MRAAQHQRVDSARAAADGPQRLHVGANQAANRFIVSGRVVLRMRCQPLDGVRQTVAGLRMKVAIAADTLGQLPKAVAGQCAAGGQYADVPGAAQRRGGLQGRLDAHDGQVRVRGAQ